MGTVLVLSALAQERAAVTERLERPIRSRLRGLSVIEGLVGRRPVVVAEVGIGKVNAAGQTALLIDRHDPNALLFTGVAGGLDPQLAIGDVVVATDLVQHDAGFHGPDGFTPYQAGHVPFFNPTVRLGHPTSPRMLDSARSALRTLGPLAPVSGRVPRLVFGRILTGDSFVASATVRARLRTMLDGVAVEMEGAAVAQTAERMGVDHLIVRAVSDLAGDDSRLDFTTFLEEVAANSAAVVAAVLGALDDP